MSVFLHKRNIDNVFFRCLIVALLGHLKDKIKIQNIDNTGVTVDVNVPFLYNAAGDGAFWQDIFMQNTVDDYIDIKMTEGNTDQLPRAHVTLSSITINSASLTNRFVPGEYVKEVNGELLTYTSLLNLIPLSCNFDIELHADGKLSLFKCIEKIIEIFYKVHSISFIFNGFVVEAQIGFPEDKTFENVYEFTFGDPTRSKLTFPIACETYLPVIDKTNEMLKSNRIQDFETIIDPEHYTIIQQQDGYLKVSNSEYVEGLVSALDLKNRKGYLGTNVFPSDGSEINLSPDQMTSETDVDHNIHTPGEFGVPTTNVDDKIEFKKESKERIM